MMGEFLRDLMNPFSNPEEVSSVSIESDVNDKLLGVNIETFLHEVSQCHQKIEEYDGNLVQIERLQTNIWKGLKWGLEQRRKMSEEIGEKSARNKQIHTEVRKVRMRNHKYAECYTTNSASHRSIVHNANASWFSVSAHQK